MHVAGYDPSVCVVPMMMGIDLVKYFDAKMLSGLSGSKLLGPPMVNEFPSLGNGVPLIAASIR